MDLTPNKRGRPRTCPTVRFWVKVQKTAACWIWMGTKTTGGYGQFCDWNGNRVGAHRFAYKLLIGPIPSGLTIDHLCRNPACVRPDHLQLVTIQENIRRGNCVQAVNARKTHCIRGHPFDEQSSCVRPKQRVCRTCKSQNQRRRRSIQRGFTVE